MHSLELRRLCIPRNSEDDFNKGGLYWNWIKTLHYHTVYLGNVQNIFECSIDISLLTIDSALIEIYSLQECRVPGKCGIWHSKHKSVSQSVAAYRCVGEHSWRNSFPSIQSHGAGWVNKEFNFVYENMTFYRPDSGCVHIDWANFLPR